MAIKVDSNIHEEAEVFESKFGYPITIGTEVLYTRKRL
jgi:hypothetical protein